MYWYRFFSHLTAEEVMAFATVGYLAVTFVMFLQLRSQVRIMQRQLESGHQQTAAMTRQTEVMEEQARTLRDQIRLQSVGMRQWLVIRDWGHKAILREGDDGKLEVEACVVNKTKYPLTLLGCRFTLKGSVTVTGEEGVSHTLVPDDIFRVKFWAPITRQQIAEIEMKGFPFRLSSNIAFIDVLKDRQDQKLSGVLECRRNDTQFIPEVSAIEAQQEEEE